jgi:hypothetical protein
MPPFLPYPTNVSDPNDSGEDLLVVGWRETIALPEFGLETLSAKLDTGASLSSLHAMQIELISKRRESWVRFWTQSDDVDSGSPIRCEARCLGERAIRSSNGHVETRPIIETVVYLGGFQWPIEITLNDRSSLDCKVLLGRSALASRCIIDCSRKHLLSRP